MSQLLVLLLDDLTSRVMTNCTFAFKDKDGTKKTLAAHQNILGAVSPVFRAMFFGPLIQTSSDEIQISGVSHRCFEKLLWAIYGKEFTIENGDEAFELYEAAEKYNISSAREIVRDYMIKTNNISTASLYFKAGVLFQDQELETASKDIFANAIYNVTKSPDFFVKTEEIVHANGLKIENDCIADLSAALQPFKDSIKKEDNLNARISKTLQLIRFLTTETGHLFATIISPSVAAFDCSLNFVPPQGTMEELKKHMTIYLNCALHKNPSGFGTFGNTTQICSCKSHVPGEASSQLVSQLMGKYLTGNLSKYTLFDVQAIFAEFKKFLFPQPPCAVNTNAGLVFGTPPDMPFFLSSTNKVATLKARK